MSAPETVRVIVETPVIQVTTGLPGPRGLQGTPGDGDVGAQIAAAPVKVTPVDADTFGFLDSVSGLLRKLSWANIKAMFATVATTGAYDDLSGRPTLGSAAAASTGDFDAAGAASGAVAAHAAGSGVHAPAALSSGGATPGQVLQWTGAAWVPATVGGASPGGVGAELQYRASATELGAVPGSAVDGQGRVSLGAGGSPVARVHAAAVSASEPAVVAQMFAGQSAAGLEVRTSAGTVIACVLPATGGLGERLRVGIAGGEGWMLGKGINGVELITSFQEGYPGRHVLHQFNPDGKTQLNCYSAGAYLSFAFGGAEVARFAPSTFRFQLYRPMSWGATTSGTQDVELSRSAAAVLALSNPVAGGAALELAEMSEPTAPAANKARLFLEDDGAGKTRLMVRFPSGTSQQISAEP